LVVAMTEAEVTAHEPGKVYETSFRLRVPTIAGRASTLLKKSKRVPPDEIAALMTLALRCKDLPAALRLFRSLMVLAGTQGPQSVARAVEQLLAL
jgi:hypothetical protein